VQTLDDALLGDGLFWRLRDGAGMTSQEKSDFGESLGHLLEEHCLEVLEASWPAERRKERFFREFRYAEGDTPDIIITEPGASAFIEIGINRPNLRDTVFLGELESFDADVERIILHRAEQLSRKIEHALGGTLPLQAAPTDTLRRIYPVICLWDGFPLGPYLYPRILGRVRAADYLTRTEIAPLQMISVDEFELLCGLIAAGRRLTDLLAEHAEGALRDEPIGEFLRASYPHDLKLPPSLARDFEGIGHRLARGLFADAGQGGDPASASGAA